MRTIELSQGRVALVDDCDFEWLSSYSWHVTFGHDREKPYAKRSEGNRCIRMHREILKAPAGMVVDHINGNTLDNRRCNLRLATFRQNTMNRKGNRNNPTGRKGVKVRERGGYEARIQIKGKSVYLGRFKTIEEAGAVYDMEARKVHGRFWHNSSHTADTVQ